ncbi:MAG TPA: DinB family protein [Vicinamibacterales bacterium]|jgi:uncharacterized damage-inducible protein DinB
MRLVLTGAAAVLLATFPASAFAQDAYTKAARAQFDLIKGNLSKTAAKVPEELYSFKPTPEVRSLGEIIGHVADSNYLICGAAAGEKASQGGFEKGKHSKAELVKAIDDSIAYCDKVGAALDDTKGAAPVPFFGTQMPKLAVYNFNIQHCNEHYGNLVTYMRLKGIVPPSSEPRK